jgi:hypothetical protein
VIYRLSTSSTTTTTTTTINTHDYLTEASLFNSLGVADMLLDYMQDDNMVLNIQFIILKCNRVHLQVSVQCQVKAFNNMAFRMAMR